MLHNCYRFHEQWRVEATPEEVFRIMEDMTTMPQWWPAVVLRADVLITGDADGIGRVVQVHTRGWLPYVIRSEVETLEKRFPDSIRTRTGGQMCGDATWTFRADGPCVDLVFDLSVTAEQPVIKYLSFALWPLFAWNHRWSMKRGLESLRLELARRCAWTAAERAQIPNPPGPTNLSRRWRHRLGLDPAATQVATAQGVTMSRP